MIELLTFEQGILEEKLADDGKLKIQNQVNEKIRAEKEFIKKKYPEKQEIFNQN